MQHVHEVLARSAVSSVFQPIVDLDTGAVVAYEALARGPVGPLERPDALFAAARSAGRLAELDDLCRRAAFTGAVEQGLLAPLTLFVNVEPEVLDTAPLDDLLAIAEAAPGELRVVLEITERALATRPADLLRTVERVRAVGWSVALDDVGAETLSLAFMPLLRPDVVKLDLRLVQDRPGPAVAEIMNAVNDHAERTGALVLAEGIETQAHLLMARALGARLGQGWMFGRPAAGPARGYPVAELALPQAPRATGLDGSPFTCLPAGVALRRSPKALLIEVSKQLERQAMRLGETCVVAATFQEARHFTPSTVQRYRDLVARTGFVCALGEDLPVEPVPGVRGATLSPDDPVRGEWDVTVVSPHFSAALLARDLGDTGPDRERMFEYALTYDRDTVVAATNALLARVVPRLPTAEPAGGAVTARRPAAAAATTARAGAGGGREELLHRALAATTSGVTIAAVDQPDQPLVYVNEAFAEMAGFPVEQVLGGNCRFLQGPDTDPAAVGRIRTALAAGEECRVTLLNYRGPERTPWWNEVFLSPVVDEQGRVLQYIGVQNDVTARVEAERALALERDRAASYLARIERFASTDPLTGLANRRGMEERLETAVWEASCDAEAALAVLFLDLDGFKRVNDAHGHAVGDSLLVQTAARLSARLRRGDLLARLGGDEFLVVLCGLARPTAREQAVRVADSLAAALSAAVELDGCSVQVGVSVGVSVFPEDAPDLRGLLHAADLRMYAAKRTPAAAADRQA
jgi:diguanylate cyclase (GGDEF)-like protein/PAS domain S-box-containing protein